MSFGLKINKLHWIYNL